MRSTTALLVLVASSTSFTSCAAFSSPPNNRIFVGGNFGTLDNLARTFRAYGRIEEISLHENTAPYAFVTFVQPEAAEAALQHDSPEMEIKASQLMEPTPIRDEERRAVEEWEEMMYLAHQSNAVVQVPKSYVERLSDYCANELEGAQVLGALDTPSEEISMLYLKAATTTVSATTDDEDDDLDDDEELADKLHDASFVKYTKVYPSLHELVRGGIFDVAEQIWANQLSTLPSSSTVRVQVFPPSLQSAVLSALDEFRPTTNSGVRISTTDYTHVYSVVGLTADGSDGRGGVFMVGLTEPTSPLSKAAKRNRNDTSRAHSKLEEVFERLGDEHRPFQTRTALDCGSSNGWCQFLADDLGVQTVYSINSSSSRGALDASVADLDAVHQLSLPLDEALTQLKTTADPVDIYVSDNTNNNRKTMKQQVDDLIAARDAGVVRSGTLFVLTLNSRPARTTKVVALAQLYAQEERLRTMASGVKVSHLFSSESGERTIVGNMS